MNIKETENQLVVKLNSEIVLTIVLWILVFGFLGFRLWNSNKIKEPPVTITNNVSPINQENLDTLRSSLKQFSENFLPPKHSEPFEETTSNK